MPPDVQTLDSNEDRLKQCGWKTAGSGLWRDPQGELVYCPTLQEAVTIQDERDSSRMANAENKDKEVAVAGVGSPGTVGERT